jgi:hypothetical protein
MSPSALVLVRQVATNISVDQHLERPNNRNVRHTITTLALALAVLIPPQAHAATATFLQSDTATLGNWKGTYGQDGNVIAQHSVAVPSYASFNTAGAINLNLLDLWASDPRALLKPNYSYSPTERVESYFHTLTSMDFQIGSLDGQNHRIALYFCNYQSEPRGEMLQVLDTATGATLDSRAVANMDGGVYLVYNYSGNVTFRVVNTLGGVPTAAVSGFFWGGATTSGPPADSIPPTVSIATPAGGDVFGVVNLTATASDNVGVASVQYQRDGVNLGPLLTTPPYSYSWDSNTGTHASHTLTAIAKDAAGNSATSAAIVVNVIGGGVIGGGNATTANTAVFNRIDGTTLGNWKGNYGGDGNVIAQHSVMVPPYASFDTAGNINLRLLDLWATDPIALLKQSYSYSPTERVESYFFTPTSMDFRISANDGHTHRIAFYFANYEKLPLSMRIFAIDPLNNVVLDSRQLASTDALAVYMVYTYSGAVTFRVVNDNPAGGPPAVVSGIFWDNVPLAPPDTTPPVVTIVQPTSGQTVGGSVFVSAHAIDDSGMASMELKVDGQSLCGFPLVVALGCAWNTTLAANGPHTLVATATDTSGNVGSASITVTVANVATPAPTPPVVALTEPVGGSTVSGTVRIAGTATSAVGLRSVLFSLDGQVLGASMFLGAPPYAIDWLSGGSANGPHTISITAVDNNGLSSSASVAVNLNNPALPKIRITSPANGATLAGTVSVMVNNSDFGGSVALNWSLDGGPIPGYLTVGAAVWDTLQSLNGPHTITVNALDAAHNFSTASITVTVNNPNPKTGNVLFRYLDFGTKGNWKGVYGQDGNFIAEFSYQAPPYSMFNPVNTNRLLIDIWTSDARAPLKPTYAYAPSERVMSHWSNPKSMDFQVSATDGQQHRIALYFADWQPMAPPAAFADNRSVTVQAIRTDTGELLDSQLLPNYTGGIYLVYDYSGNITFRVINNWDKPSDNPDATVSAFFWGGPI